MASIASAILDFRLDVDEELQGWILMFASVTAVFFFCFPCYCAGLSWAPARQFASWIMQRLPKFYFFMCIFNILMLALVVHWCPAWTFHRYTGVVVSSLAAFVKQLMDCAPSLAIIIAFCIMVAFKDRIAQVFGFDYKTLFRFKARDCMPCWGGMQRFKHIELAVWKVEDLPSADFFSANNVFVEFFLGYNEVMKTRVHNNAGSGCLIKEQIHLNFDEDDEDETLYIFVRNQKVMGTSELARIDLPADKLRKVLEDGAKQGVQDDGRIWSEKNFPQPIKLVPRGLIWIHARVVDDDDGAKGFMEEMTTC